MEPSVFFSRCVNVAYGSWILLAVVWLVFAFRTKRTERRLGASRMAPYFLLLVASFVLVFGVVTLGPRIVPQTRNIGLLGAALAVGGVLIAIWARLTLANNWNASVAVKEGHELVERGPYRWVRHPIYSGILMGMAGSAFLSGSAGALVGLVLAIGQRIWKLRHEEELMGRQFPEAYPAYKARTRRLVPFIF